MNNTIDPPPVVTTYITPNLEKITVVAEMQQGMVKTTVADESRLAYYHLDNDTKRAMIDDAKTHFRRW